MAKWPATVSLNWSMAGTTTSTGKSSLVRLAIERSRSKSNVLDSCTVAAVSVRFFALVLWLLVKEHATEFASKSASLTTRTGAFCDAVKARSLVYDRLLFLSFRYRAALFACPHIYVCVTPRFAEFLTAASTGDVKGRTPCGRCRRLLEHWHRGLAQRMLPARNLYGLGVCHDVVFVNPREEIGKVLGRTLFFSLCPHSTYPGYVCTTRSYVKPLC